MKKFRLIIVALVVVASLSLVSCTQVVENLPTIKSENIAHQETVKVSEIPEFAGQPYVAINNNEPQFIDIDGLDKSFENYSPLDSLGRCGVALANIGKDLMPAEQRGSIGQVKPSGWQTVKYDFVDGKYLYNRCHLIGYQLTAENANESNLITGTRYLNIEGMLPFENMIADYIKETDKHVLYRVTPIFDGDNLVASGVQMEGKSVEDNGEAISFNVYAYNVQPGISISYLTGENIQAGKNQLPAEDVKEQLESGALLGALEPESYVLNTNTMKFHKQTCSSVNKIEEDNKEIYSGSKNKLLKGGYEPCKNCNP